MPGRCRWLSLVVGVASVGQPVIVPLEVSERQPILDRRVPTLERVDVQPGRLVPDARTDATVLLESAAALERSGDPAQALALVRWWITVGGNEDAKAHAAAGYFAQRALEETGDRTFVRHAVRHYRASLGIDPGQFDVERNLVALVKATRSIEAAIEQSRAFVERRPDPERLVLLGDLAREADSWGEAVESYERAFEVRADDLTGGRLLDLYDDPERDLKDLWRTCERLDDSGLPRLAGLGWESVASRAASEQRTEEANEAFLRWVETEASRGTLEAADLEAFEGTAIAGLEAFEAVRSIAADPTEARLPGHDPVSIHRTAVVRKSIADRMLQDALIAARTKRPEREAAMLREAASLYEVTFRDAPMYDDYQEDGALHGREVVRFDTALRLASTFQRRGEVLDPDGARFRELAWNMFGEKNHQYGQLDFEAMRAFHVVFSKIYTERGVWDELDGLPGAEYHMTRAIEVTDDLNRREPGSASPLPQFHESLATRYVETGRITEAGKHLEQATESYLEVDDVTKADRSLRRLESLEASGDLEHSPASKGLRDLIQLRLDVRRLGDASVAEDIRTFESRTAALRISTLDERFVRDQRARTLLELGNEAIRTSNVDDAARIHEQAASLLKDAHGGVSKIENAEIMRRLEVQEKRIRQGIK